jgi:protein-S-isoprenylcysteine O-methyltransferase Ste14
MTPASSRWSEFRARGGLWVVAQFALMAGITAAWLLPPDWPDSVRWPLRIVGLLLVVVGLALVFWAHGALGRAFTTLTHPPPEAPRAETGPYKYARHPMYGGGILVFAGASLAFSITALALTGGLAVLWRAKSMAEERVLVVRFTEYGPYRERTRRRFLPWIY